MRLKSCLDPRVPYRLYNASKAHWYLHDYRVSTWADPIVHLCSLHFFDVLET